jgi:hypothetical protein
MVNRRTSTIFVFLILLSPVTAVQVSRVLGVSSVSTQVTANETTLTYTSANVRTYFGSSVGTTLAGEPLSIPQRVVGFMAPQGRCSVFSLPVTIATGTLLNMKFTANNPVNFYLFSVVPSAGWPSSCNVAGGILRVNNFTDYTLHWTAPENGTFYLVFTGPTAVILLTDVGSMKPVEQTATMTLPTSTETKLAFYSSTETRTSTMTITAPLLAQVNVLNNALIVGIVIGLLIAVLLVLSRRLTQDQ